MAPLRQHANPQPQAVGRAGDPGRVGEPELRFLDSVCPSLHIFCVLLSLPMIACSPNMIPRELFPLACLAVTAMATCYFPNGGISFDDVACNPDASDSPCCYKGAQTCYSNGLCGIGEVDGILQYARGTCTDQNWLSGACPNFCLDRKSFLPAHVHMLMTLCRARFGQCRVQL